MSNPLASIIIPCYNAEALISEAIESALNQTYPHREVIVVDDGSTDSSLDVIRSFGNRVRWASGPNRGGSAARNRGLEMATGEFVQFLDADDVLYPEKLSVQVPLLASTPTLDVVFCSWVWMDRDRATSKITRRPYTGEDPLHYVLVGPLQTASGLYRATAIRRVGGFTEGMPCAQEFDLHVRMALQGMQCSSIDRVLYEFRKSRHGVSGDDVHILSQRFNILEHMYDDLRRLNTFADSRIEMLQEAVVRVGRESFQSGSHRLGRRAFLLAAQISPKLRRAPSAPAAWFARMLGLAAGLTLLETLRAMRTPRQKEVEDL